MASASTNTQTGCPMKAFNIGATCPAGYGKMAGGFDKAYGYPSPADMMMYGGYYPPMAAGAGFAHAPAAASSGCPWKNAGFEGTAEFYQGNMFGCPALFSRSGGCPLGYGRQANNWTYCNVGFRPTHAVEFYSLTNPIRMDREGNRKLWLCYELKGFLPQEITVSLDKTKRQVIVEAAQEVTEGKEHYVARKFCRKFALPESLAKVDLSKLELKSYLNHFDGLLTVECDLPKFSLEEIAKCPVLSRQAQSTEASSGATTSSAFHHAGIPLPAGYNACPVSSVNVKSI